jgi:bifunctional N-acetylglucosamine-1-phosphate-uridyltransferase/glucosamine-1-phosphate-acetyltransferase GlmU-like protein
MERIAGLVLAAGRGTRMKSPLPKVLVPLAGQPVIQHLLDHLEAAGIADLTVVVGHRADEVRAALGPRYRYALQAEQRGMAHAVAAARPLLEGRARHVLVTVGDSPLLRPATVRALLDHHLTSGAACTFLTAVIDPPPPYARVLRDPDGRVRGCVEERDCTPAQAAVRELLTSHYVFAAPALWTWLDAIPPHPVTGERYLTDITGLFDRAGLPLEALPVGDPLELMGLNTLEEVELAARWWEAHGG